MEAHSSSLADIAAAYGTTEDMIAALPNSIRMLIDDQMSRGRNTWTQNSPQERMLLMAPANLKPPTKPNEWTSGSITEWLLAYRRHAKEAHSHGIGATPHPLQTLDTDDARKVVAVMQAMSYGLEYKWSNTIDIAASQFMQASHRLESRATEAITQSVLDEFLKHHTGPKVKPDDHTQGYELIAQVIYETLTANDTPQVRIALIISELTYQYQQKFGESIATYLATLEGSLKERALAAVKRRLRSSPALDSWFSKICSLVMSTSNGRLNAYGDKPHLRSILEYIQSDILICATILDSMETCMKDYQRSKYKKNPEKSHTAKIQAKKVLPKPSSSELKSKWNGAGMKCLICGQENHRAYSFADTGTPEMSCPETVRSPDATESIRQRMRPRNRRRKAPRRNHADDGSSNSKPSEKWRPEKSTSLFHPQ